MAHTEAVTSLSLDPVESRFLLSGSADASVALYDVIDRPSAPSTQPEVTEPLAKIHRRHTGAHRFMITGVEWFPHDTGLFASSSTDGTIKLWDTNELRVAAEFAPGGAVHRIAMSHAATTHTLIAAAAEQSYAVQLCDPVSGTATHQLSGHRQAVSALSWSPSDENQLVSGGADRSIRVWDLRRANSCLRTLDLRDTRQERRRLSPFRESGTPTPVAAASHATRSPTAHNGAITGLQFVPDGTMLLSSGRDGRLRLWHAATGENMNVHYASAHGGSARAKQLAVGAGGCGVRSARVYFPSPDGVLTYDLCSGRRLPTLKAHFGEVTCCVASSLDQRLFSGGEDRTVNVWAPPPCGLAQPAPLEDASGRTSRSLSDAAATASTAAVDEDAWSDDEACDGDGLVARPHASRNVRARR